MAEFFAKLGIGVDSRQVQKGSAELDKLSSAAKRAEGATAKLSKLKKLGEGIGLALAYKAVLDNTIEAEKATSNLNATLVATGRFTAELSAQMLEYSKSLQHVSIFGDEAITASQTILAGFTSIGGPVFQRAQESILDIASKLGTDLPDAARTVGLALEDPIKGTRLLRSLNVSLSKSQVDLVNNFEAVGDRASAQGVILSALEVSSKGAAAAARNTLGGALSALKESFGDLLEGDASGPGGLTSAVNDLIATMNDPGVKAGFASMVKGLLDITSAAASAVSTVANVTGFLLDAQRAKVFGPQLDDLVRLDDQAANARATLEALKKAAADRPGDRTFVEALAKATSDLAEKESLLEAGRKGVASSLPAGGGPPNIAAIAGTSAGDIAGSAAANSAKQAFDSQKSSLDDLIQGMRERIALFGLEGEASQLSALIQLGNFDKLSAADKNRAIDLAKQIDMLNANAQATKDAADKQEAAANAAQALFDKNQSSVDALKLQADVIGKSQDDVTLYKLALEGATTAQIGQAKSALETVSAYEAQQQATKDAADKQAEISALYQSNIELITGLDSASQNYGEKLGELNRLLDAGAISQADYNSAVGRLGDTLDETAKKVDEAGNKMTDFADQAARNIQDTFAEFLFDPFAGGLKGMVSGFADMLRKVTAQAVAADLLHSIGLGGQDNHGGNVDIIAGGLGKLFGSLFGGAHANGGMIPAGRIGLVGERGPELITGGRAGTTVIPMPNIRGASGSGGTVVNVQNIAHGGSVETTQEKGPDGSIMIKNWFRAELKDAFASGSMDKIMAPMGARRRGY